MPLSGGIGCSIREGLGDISAPVMDNAGMDDRKILLRSPYGDDRPPGRWVPLVLLVSIAVIAVVGQIVGWSDNGEAETVDSESTTLSAPVGSAGVGSSYGCTSAPDEVGVESASHFTVSPNPLKAGDPVEFWIRTVEGTSVEPVVGYGATWECWTGDPFVATHLLEFGASFQGMAIEGSPGSTTTVPGIAHDIPATFTSTVPDVHPGWYRLRVDYLDQGERSVNLLMVEVVD